MQADSAEQDWQRWAETWQQQPLEVDVPGLLAAVRQRRRSLFIGVALELAGTLIVTAAVAALWQRPDAAALRGWSLVALAIVWLFQFAALGLRRSLLSALALDPGALLGWLERRVRSRIRYVWLTVLAMLMLMLIALSLGGLLPQAVWIGSPLQRAPLAQGLLLAGMGLGTGLWACLSLRRQRAELRRIASQRAQL